MTTLLVLTVGQSDVQIVVDGVRRELSRDRCAALHDELERRGYGLVDTPVVKESSRDTLPDGELNLCTPKLDAVLREALPDAALVLETRREPSAAPGDPRIAGNVVEARLKAKGVRMVHRHTYLGGRERLENREDPHDAVIRHEVVHRLDSAVRDAIKVVAPSRIVVAATGGFPVVTNLVEEIVRLHASVPVEALEVADGARANPPTADRAVARMSIPEPLASFQARRRALELIEKGNLLGAWAVVEPLHTDEVEHRWTQVIEWLARYAASLPMPKGCDIAILSHSRMAVRAALRVEFALRAGDIPRAVHGTVAFFEAVLWDRLIEYFERDPQDARWLKLRNDKTAPAGKLLRDGGDDDKNRPFECKERPYAQPWFWFHESGAGRFARDYVKSQALKSLVDAIDKVKTLRNDVAHNEPTPTLMDDASSRMQAVLLWSSRGTFLSQPLVQNVLREVGEANPSGLLEDLLSGVRRRIVESAPVATYGAP